MLPTLSDGDAISRRYGATAAGEWQNLLHHVDYAEDFALLVLAVPDADGARLCHGELERVLAQDGKQLLAFDADTPEALRAHAAELPEQPIPESVGACWLAGVAPQSAAEFPQWRSAWRRALEGLNQQRNPLRRHLPCPLVVVAAPWVIPLFRDVAPDLWSVRSQVVHIEPEPGRLRDGFERSIDRPRERRMPNEGSVPDPELAHREVERLRGVSGRERDLGLMLIREGAGLLDRSDDPKAEAAFREAESVLTAIGEKIGAAAALYGLAVTLRGQGRSAEAEAALNRALDLKKEGSDTVISRGVIMRELGEALRDQGRAAEAEATFRQALALHEEGGATAFWGASTMDGLGRALRNQGRAAEAEAAFRRALVLKEEGSDTSVSRGFTMAELGRALRDQGRAAEAETALRHALALKEEGSDTALSRSTTMVMLGLALLDQGRAAESEAAFRRALELVKEAGDAGGLRAISAVLAYVVREQGRVAEAILHDTEGSAEGLAPAADGAT